LEQAVNDLPAEGERTIVLVCDSEETCDRDPCQAARDLIAKGIDVTVETVSFQVNDVAPRQLECIAEATGGEYRDVLDAAALAGALRDL
jgi:Ca-activated chloride channel family protein